MEMNLFFTNSFRRHQNIIHIMTAMLKIRFKMASIQNEEDASNELDFKTQTEDGTIRNLTIKEEFIDSVSEEYFSKNSVVTRIHSYLSIMHKYAGKEIDIMIEHLQTRQSMQSSLRTSSKQLLVNFIGIKTLFCF